MLRVPRWLRANSDDGFSLTETIVSLAIIGVVLTSTGAFLSRTSDLMHDGLAAQAAQQQLTLEVARIQSVPFDDLALPEFGQTSCATEGRPISTAINATDTVVQGDVSMTINRTVTWAGSGDQALAGDSVTCGTASASAQMKQANVEVTYTLPTGQSGTVRATVLRSAGSESVVSIAAGPGTIAMKPNESKVNTIAGSVAGFTGGAGTSARFKEPGDVAVHPTTGDLYVADTFNNAIRAINPATGNVTTVLGGNSRGSDVNGKPTPDASFTANVSGGPVLAVENYANGKTIIGGDFTSIGGVSRNRIARLNDDGTVDTTFNTGSGTNGPVLAIAVQNDGKVIIGGDFTSVGGVSRNHIARLNTDGTVDTTFGNNQTGANSEVRSVALRSDGRIIIGGKFTRVNQSTRNRIAQLNADGSLDKSFSSQGAGTDGPVNTMSLQDDGKLVIGGGFSRVDGSLRSRVARLTGDGTNDASFTGPSIGGGEVRVLRRHQGGILIGGDFTSINGIPVAGVAKINSSGLISTDFGTFTRYNAFPAPVEVWGMAVDDDERIVIAGDFQRIQGESRSHLARLNADGTLDSSLNTYGGATAPIYALALAPDGKFVIGGEFTRYGEVTASRIARVNPNGTATFNMIAAIAFAPDGTLYATDRWNNRVLRINTSTWRVQVLAGRWPGFRNGTGENASFLNPSGLAVAANGDVYVADTGNHAIRKITPQGVVTTVAGSPGAGYGNGTASTAKFNQPWDVVVAPTGDVYVSDWFNHAIRKITPDGTVTTHAGRLPDGNLASPLAPQQVTAWPGDEKASLTWTPPGSTGGTPIAGYQVQWSSNGGATWSSAAKASQWTGFTVTKLNNGTSYVFRVRAVNLTGEGPWSAPTSPVTPSRNPALRPEQAPVDAVNDLLATDGMFRDGVGSAARFNNPMGLALDASNGIIYVADQMNHRIRAVTYSGAVTTVAGSQSGYADSAARASRFMRPTGVAFTSGQLVIADTGNHLIRRVTLP